MPNEILVSAHNCLLFRRGILYALLCLFSVSKAGIFLISAHNYREAVCYR